MAIYEYIAIDVQGNRYSGTSSDVTGTAVLKDELAKMGDTLIKATHQRSGRGIRPKIKQAEIVSFAYKFAGMYAAGLSISRCIETIERQTEIPALKYVLADIRQSIARGSSLRDAFEKHKHIFSDFFLGMLEAGESGGKLHETLEISATYLEKQADLRHKITAAFAYPVVVAVMCILIVTALIIFVIPVFSNLYKQLNVPLPGPTQTLVNLSVVVINWWWMLLSAIIALIFIVRFLANNPKLRAAWSIFKLNMPVFAKLNRMVVVTRFMRTFAMLISAGISLIKALDVADIVANNAKISEIVVELQQSIEAGQPVAASLEKYDIFPPIITQMVASGEEAGTLPEMLNKGLDFLDKDIERIIKSLMVKLEPAITLIMGIIVGFILLGVYLPMFDYMSRVK